jgi:hypothetical protein
VRLLNQSSEKPDFDTTDVPARRGVSTHHRVSPKLSGGRSPHRARVVRHSSSGVRRKRRTLLSHSRRSNTAARNLPASRSQPPSSSPPLCRSIEALHRYPTRPPRRSRRVFPSKSPVLPCRRDDTARLSAVETALKQTGLAFQSPRRQSHLVAKMRPSPRLRKSSHLQGFAPPMSPYCRQVVANLIDSLSFHGLCSPPRSRILRFRPASGKADRLSSVGPELPSAQRAGGRAASETSPPRFTFQPGKPV